MGAAPTTGVCTLRTLGAQPGPSYPASRVHGSHFKINYLNYGEQLVHCVAISSMEIPMEISYAIPRLL